MHTDSVSGRRALVRASGVLLACCALGAGLVALERDGAGRAAVGSLLQLGLPKLAPLQQLHWVNHEFREVHKAATQSTPLERADREAELQAQTAARWGTLAATKDVFRSRRFTSQLERMKANAQLSESKAQKLESEIHYEGKLLEGGRKGVPSIIAQATLAAHDATAAAVSSPVRSPSAGSRGDGRTFRSHKFVEVYPKPYHYATGTSGSRQFKKEEKSFLAGVNHEVRMRKLAVNLKLQQKADGAAADPDGSSDGILESRTDMSNGVEQSATAAAAKRLAISRAGALDTAHGTNLAPAKDGDAGLLDNKRDMGNGIDAKGTQEAARKLATSLVRKMQESADAESTALSGAAAAGGESGKKKQATDPDADKATTLQDWAKANPEDDARVRQLKKELWQAEERQAGQAHGGAQLSQRGAQVAASAAREIEISAGKTRAKMIGKVWSFLGGGVADVSVIEECVCMTSHARLVHAGMCTPSRQPFLSPLGCLCNSCAAHDAGHAERRDEGGQDHRRRYVGGPDCQAVCALARRHGRFQLRGSRSAD